jgi:hypothetical protein
MGSVRWRYGQASVAYELQRAYDASPAIAEANDSISRWIEAGWPVERILPMLTSYMGNVRDRGFLRYFELTPSRYYAQLECLNLVSGRLGRTPGRQTF